MITIYTIPRPWTGIYADIQWNAFQSWLALRPRPQVLIFGDDETTYRMARTFGLPYLSVEQDAEGVPLVSSAIEQANQLTQHDIRCFANADNLYMSDFLPAVRRVAAWFEQFLIVGRRYCLAIEGCLDFEGDWEGALRARLAEAPDPLHHYSAIDYLVYRGTVWDMIPAFSVGRGAYDNWLVQRALEREVPVVDATLAMTVIHQDHPGKSTPTTARNHELFVRFGGRHTTIQQATWALGTDGELIER